MPDGRVQRVDTNNQSVTIVRSGRRYVAPLSEVSSESRVVGARVHFDFDHHSGPDSVKAVSLLSGTRTNKRQRRFGDLTGSKRPGAKVKDTAASRLGVDATTQPVETVETWLQVVADRAFDDATSLYSPNAVLHTADRTHVGRKAIRAALEDASANAADPTDEPTITAHDQTVRVDGSPNLVTEFEIHRGAIVEQWLGLPPDDTDVEASEDPVITIIRSGEVSAKEEQRLRDDLARIVRRLPQPVEEVRVKIDEPSAPHRPYSTSAAIHSGTMHVRSHVTAATLVESIDEVCLRLRRQIERAVDRRQRPPEQHRPDGDSWRHGDRQTLIAKAATERPARDRAIVRHKIWGPALSTVNEAIWDMEQADYDFFLFTEETSGEVGLTWHDDDELKVQLLGGTTIESDFATVITDSAPVMSVPEAADALDQTERLFTFAASPEGTGYVLYRRLDGDLGLIESG